MNTSPLLQISNLSIDFTNPYGKSVRAVDEVSIYLQPGDTLAIVGESGCGKSTLALSIMGLLPNSIQSSGEIIFENKNLLKFSESEMQKIRGHRIAMIFQDPMTSLSPFMTIGDQIAEQIKQHQKLDSAARYKKVLELLKDVGIPNPEERYHRYPHEFSGGMRQRVMIACALSCEPTLLIADEPTTALDVTIQAQIMELIAQLVRQRNMSLLLITHDLGVVAETCEKVAVMYAGQIVETGNCKEIFNSPEHPYTHALLQSLPRLTDNRSLKLLTIQGQPPIIEANHKLCRFYERCHFKNESCRTKQITLIEKSPSHQHLCTFKNTSLENFKKEPLHKKEPNSEKLLVVENLKMHFKIEGNLFGKNQIITKAVDDVNLFIKKGEVLGLVGESGCGKSTLSRAILQLIKPTSGKVFFNSMDLCQANKNQIQQTRQKIQLIFQDPFGSLNSRLKVFDIIAEPLINFYKLSNNELKTKVFELMNEVGLNPDWGNRYPHQFSGGQRQRIGIARALSVEPEILFCDEPISALDVSIQAQIINLLQDLQIKRNLTILFISHDLSVVRRISDRIAVMYQGKIVEIADAESIYINAKHPYTKTLLNAIPQPSIDFRKEKEIFKKSEFKNLPADFIGCRFYPRCPKATERCQTELPILTGSTNHQVACFFSNEGESKK